MLASSRQIISKLNQFQFRFFRDPPLRFTELSQAGTNAISAPQKYWLGNPKSSLLWDVDMPPLVVLLSVDPSVCHAELLSMQELV
jgi:hypothetical protein